MTCSNKYHPPFISYTEDVLTCDTQVTSIPPAAVATGVKTKSPMNKLVSIHEAARLLGVSDATLRRWDKSGRLTPDYITRGGHRRYNLDKLLSMQVSQYPQEQQALVKQAYHLQQDVAYINTEQADLTYLYLRVAHPHQKAQWQKQLNLALEFCQQHYGQVQSIMDIGRGTDMQRSGLKNLLQNILKGRIKRLILLDRYQLLPVGYEVIERLCYLQNIEIIYLAHLHPSLYRQCMQVHLQEEETLDTLIEMCTRMSLSLPMDSEVQTLIQNIRQRLVHWMDQQGQTLLEPSAEFEH